LCKKLTLNEGIPRHKAVAACCTKPLQRASQAHLHTQERMATTLLERLIHLQRTLTHHAPRA
jgi:hypothetical protein